LYVFAHLPYFCFSVIMYAIRCRVKILDQRIV
jgi:hypothetical protein